MTQGSGKPKTPETLGDKSQNPATLAYGMPAVEEPRAVTAEETVQDRITPAWGTRRPDLNRTASGVRAAIEGADYERRTPTIPGQPAPLPAQEMALRAMETGLEDDLRKALLGSVHEDSPQPQEARIATAGAGAQVNVGASPVTLGVPTRGGIPLPAGQSATLRPPAPPLADLGSSELDDTTGSGTRGAYRKTKTLQDDALPSFPLADDSNADIVAKSFEDPLDKPPVKRPVLDAEAGRYSSSSGPETKRASSALPKGGPKHAEEMLAGAKQPRGEKPGRYLHLPASPTAYRRGSPDEPTTSELPPDTQRGGHLTGVGTRPRGTGGVATPLLAGRSAGAKFVVEVDDSFCDDAQPVDPKKQNLQTKPVGGGRYAILPSTGRRTPNTAAAITAKESPQAKAAGELINSVPPVISTVPEPRRRLAMTSDGVTGEAGRNSRQVTTKRRPRIMPEVAELEQTTTKKPSLWDRIRQSTKTLLAVGYAAALTGLLAEFAKEAYNNETYEGQSSASLAPTQASGVAKVSAAPKIVTQSAPVATQAPKVEATKGLAAKALETQPLDLTKVKMPEQLATGKLKMSSNNILRDTIHAFQNTANEQQKVELQNLRQLIYLGLGVYFNEHFGTPEKLTESLANPNIKNLHDTAKIAFNSNKHWIDKEWHTKKRFGQAYDFATEILKEAHELGWDESSSKDAVVRENARGNMFNAKMRGETVSLQTASGRNHIVMTMAQRIMAGQTAQQAMATELQVRLAATGAPAAKSIDGSKTGLNTQPKNLEIPQFLPNIAPAKVLMEEDTKNELAKIDAGWEDLLDEAKNKVPQVIDGQSVATPVAALKAFEEKKKVTITFDFGATTSQENNSVIPKVADQIASLYPKADGEKIRSLVKRYGWVGFKVSTRQAGQATIELNENLYKILQPLTKRSAQM